jgi:hypothetical protein
MIESNMLNPGSVGERPKMDHNDVRAKINWLYWPDTSTQGNYADDSLAHAEITSRPDIIDEAVISWGLAQSQKMKPGAKVDVLSVDETNLCKYSPMVRGVCASN